MWWFGIDSANRAHSMHSLRSRQIQASDPLPDSATAACARPRLYAVLPPKGPIAAHHRWSALRSSAADDAVGAASIPLCSQVPPQVQLPGETRRELRALLGRADLPARPVRR